MSQADSQSTDTISQLAETNKLNRRLAKANAESAEMMAELDEKNASLRAVNAELSRANAEAAELVATLELKDDEIRALNREVSAACARAAEFLADREIQLEQIQHLNQALNQEVADKVRAYEELKRAVQEIQVLQSILPICGFCKKIRDDGGKWSNVDAYIVEHTPTKFSHTFCPQCFQKHYPDSNDG